MHQTLLSDLPYWPIVMNAALITQGPRSLKTTQALYAQPEMAARDQDWVDIGDKLEVCECGPCLPIWDPDNLNVLDNFIKFKIFISDLTAMNSGAQWRFASLPLALHGTDKALVPWLQVGGFSPPSHSCGTIHCPFCEQTPGALTFGWRGPWSCQCTKDEMLAALPTELRAPSGPACAQCRLRSQISKRAAVCRLSASRTALIRAAQVRQEAGWFIRRPGPAPAPRDFLMVLELTITSDEEEELWEAKLPLRIRRRSSGRHRSRSRSPSSGRHQGVQAPLDPRTHYQQRTWTVMHPSPSTT
jgi:hypothetical protein